MAEPAQGKPRAMSKDSAAHPSDVLRPRHVGAPIKRTEDPRLLTGQRRIHGRPQAGSAAARRLPPKRAAACADRAHRHGGGADGAGRRRRVHGGRHRRRFQAGDSVLADGQLLRDADPAARFRKGSLCRRGHRRGRRHFAISRGGRARADRDRVRTARGGFAQRAGGRRRTLRCCTKRPAPTS